MTFFYALSSRPQLTAKTANSILASPWRTSGVVEEKSSVQAQSHGSVTVWSKVVGAIAMTVALLVSASRAQAHDTKTEERAERVPPRALLHVESETEFALTSPVVGQVFTGEIGLRVSGRLFVTASALLHVGDTTHVGGGLGLRYESPQAELFGRVTFDHRIAEFPQNAIRAEVRGTWWAHPHFGFVGRLLAENFPSPLNAENGGEWDLVTSGGAMGRVNHHFSVGLLGTLRLPDVTGVRHVHAEIEPGLLLLAELAVP